VVDWGGKVAAWFAGVTVAAATLAGLISGTAKPPLHGLPLFGFIILVVICRCLLSRAAVHWASGGVDRLA
jgi:hypothetical protein